MGLVISYMAVNLKTEETSLFERMEDIGSSHIVAHGVAVLLAGYSLVGRFVFNLEPRDRDVRLSACNLLNWYSFAEYYFSIFIYSAFLERFNF